ncbi:MAG TPA: type II toxin-antitoxin system VapC family toxin [Vicinamibacterales bacterium]|nr:type II toxin-antitoxin system VapC family toxin [Vicinamibacterales bacterium]
MSYLLDSNIVSELRKRERADAGVRQWFAGVDDSELFLSVLTVGELRRGIESIHRRDRTRALVLNRWFHALVTQYEARILLVDQKVAEEWGRMNALATLPAIDSLLAATAHVHGLTFVTRNTKDVARTGVPCLNPFQQ